MMFGVWLVTNLAALRLFAKELKKTKCRTAASLNYRSDDWPLTISAQGISYPTQEFERGIVCSFSVLAFALFRVAPLSGSSSDMS